MVPREMPCVGPSPRKSKRGCVEDGITEHEDEGHEQVGSHIRGNFSEDDLE